MDYSLISEVSCGTGEGPVWIGAESALYWTDIPAKKIYRWHEPTQKLSHWDTPEMVGCFAHCTSGQWLAAMESGLFKLLLKENGECIAQKVASVNHPDPNMRFNDGRCDRQGRFFSGTMHFDLKAAHAIGSFYQYRHSGQLQNLLTGFICPNGLAFSPDGKILYMSDSHPNVQTIWAFDYDIDDGVMHNRRVFVDMHHHQGRPDGAAVDAEGCYWICANDAGMVSRFTPEGKLDRSVEVPAAKPAMCAFGGDNLDTLYVTSIRPSGLTPDEQPLAGRVFAVDPGVKGLPEPSFKDS